MSVHVECIIQSSLPLFLAVLFTHSLNSLKSNLKLSMDRHSQTVRHVSQAVRDFHKQGKPYRIFHGSSNSTRKRPTGNVVDISDLCNVIEVDVDALTVLVEPNVPMDRLVDATIVHGLIPPVVMEFPGITAGGGYAGTSGESSSFRHGFFNETINYVEMVLGNGDVVKASATENKDLFYGAAGAAGTLGITTMMELRLVRTKAFIKTSYYRTKSVRESVDLVQQKTHEITLDYIDGILYSQSHGVVITGEMTDEMPEGSLVRTFSHATDPWYYMYVHDRTKSLKSESFAIDYIPIAEYLFRYDRAGFWVGREGYTYFKYIPFNGFFRWLLDDFSHTRTLYHALHASGISDQFVVQDLGLPYDTAAEFIDFVDEELGIWPLWLCPLKAARCPTFHPVTLAASNSPHVIYSRNESLSMPMLNIGVWGWGPSQYNDFVQKNKLLEENLTQLGGRKWLYAQTYYSETEFWKLYGKAWYQQLREKYHATTLPSVFDKVRTDVEAERQKKRASSRWLTSYSWAESWPFGGLYGMWLAVKSGDIYVDRSAQWKQSRGSNSVA